MKKREKFKIVLLSPPTDIRKMPNPPIGLCYIKSYLLKNGFLNTKVIDMNLSSYHDVKRVLLEEKPDILGITSVSESRCSALKAAEMAKLLDDKVKVVLGGPHVTNMYSQILKHYGFIDVICLGEGEITFFELAEAILDNSGLLKVKGIAYRDRGEIVAASPREFINDLDSLPFPNYDDLNIELYRNYDKIVNPGKEIQGSIVSSRSCPYSCFFCSARKFWGNKWRTRSPRNIVDEIEYFYKKYDTKCFNFTDDNFMVDNNRVIDICHEILERNLKISWFSHTRVDNVSVQALKAMKEAGCEVLAFGVDSGSEKVLKAMDKRITISQVMSAFNMVKEAGLGSQLNIIVGHAGEDINTLKETKELISRVKPDMLCVSVIKIYPGTPLYELAKKEGVCDDNFWLTQKPCPYYTKTFTLSELVTIQRSLYWHFYKMGGLKGIFDFMRFSFNHLKGNWKDTIKKQFISLLKYNR